MAGGQVEQGDWVKVLVALLTRTIEHVGQSLAK